MYSRSRSFSCSSLSSLLCGGGSQPGLATRQPATPVQYNSLRRMHGSILNPRAPKIRHLNASHTLLVDLEQHIKRVQDLENTVIRMEMELQRREANKSLQASGAASAPASPTTLMTASRPLVSEAEQAAFRLRLEEAKRKAEQLSVKTANTEADILRSWHSKRLRLAWESLAGGEDGESTTKLLANPVQTEQSNGIFQCLEILVDTAHTAPPTEAERSGQRTEEISRLLDLKDQLRHQIETCSSRLHLARSNCTECLSTLESVRSSRHQLAAQAQLAQSVYGLFLPRVGANSPTDYLFIFGPNPIYEGARKKVELDCSLQTHYVQEMLKQLDLSEARATTNLATARQLVAKYTDRLQKARTCFGEVAEAVEALLLEMGDAKVVEEKVVECDTRNKGVDGHNLKAGSRCEILVPEVESFAPQIGSEKSMAWVVDNSSSFRGLLAGK